MFDLVNAKDDFYQAHRDLVHSQYRLLLNRLGLWASTGELSEFQVRGINANLAPPEPSVPPSKQVAL